MEVGAALVAYTVACAAPRADGSPAPRFEDFLPQREVVQEQDADALLAQAMRDW